MSSNMNTPNKLSSNVVVSNNGNQLLETDQPISKQLKYNLDMGESNKGSRFQYELLLPLIDEKKEDNLASFAMQND